MCVRSSSARCARNGATPSASMAASVTPSTPGRALLGAHQGPGVTQEVGPGDLVIEEVEPEGGLRLGLAVQLPLEVPHRSGGSSLTAILPRAPRRKRSESAAPSLGGGCVVLRLPAVLRAAPTAWPAPGGFGVGLIRQGWTPVAHRPGSPVVPREAVPACHPCYPGGSGLAWQVWWPDRRTAFPLRSRGRHPQILFNEATAGFAARCDLRGCALLLGSARQGTQCFRLPVAPPSSYLGDAANSQGRTSTGKSHGIHGMLPGTERGPS